MRIKIAVLQDKLNKWQDRKNNVERTDRILVGGDDEGGTDQLDVMLNYVLNEEEAKAHAIGTFNRKTLTCSINWVMQVGSNLKMKGRIVEVDGKPWATKAA